MDEDDTRSHGCERGRRLGVPPWAGMEVVEAARRRGRGRDGRADHHLNLQGLVHGGVLATLADTARAWRCARDGAGAAPRDDRLDVRFLRPPRPAARRPREGGARGALIAFAEAAITDERGRAAGAGAVAILGDRQGARG